MDQERGNIGARRRPAKSIFYPGNIACATKVGYRPAMSEQIPQTFTAFEGERRLAAGSVDEVRGPVRDALARRARVLVFGDEDGRQVDLDLRDPPPERRRPGRPKLGVEAREITLLPRHWDWLARQRGGASATLRRLVETASREGSARDRARQAMDAAYRFATAMAGDAAGYEEAIRALFAGDAARFDAHSASWPEDVRAHVRKLAEPAFAAGG
jgi:hypothetical protein